MKPQVIRHLIAAVASFLALTAPFAGYAIETKVIRDDSFSQYNQGESTGTELLSTGRLRIAPRAERLQRTDDGVAWRIAVDPVDSSVYYSTGHSGKVYKHTTTGKPELWADLTELEAIALVIDPTGALLIGASPGGKIYRVVEPGKPQLFFETKEQYVWDMVFDANGTLYAATGPNGKIFRIRGERNGEVYYDSDATNVMSLAFDVDGSLVAATQGKGFVLRIRDTRDGYVLYASSEDEIRALARDAHGNLYAAVNSARTSSVFDRSDSREDRPASAMNTPSALPTPSSSSSSSSSRSEDYPSSSASFGLGLGGQSFLVQIQPSGFVTNFWPSAEGPIHSILADHQTSSILVAAGKRGKIYRVGTEDANHSVVADVEEPMILAMARLAGRTYFATANKSALYELVTTGPVQQGQFASRPFNAGTTVQWGNLFYEAEEPHGSEVIFETRSGNTPEPTDGTWSKWAPSERVAERIVKITSPVAQYLQYRATLRAPAGTEGPSLASIPAFYVQRNAAPILRNVDITKIGSGTPPTASSTSFGSLAATLGARIAVPSPTPRPGGSGSDEPSGSSRTSSPTGSTTAAGPPPSSTSSRDEADLRPAGSGFAVSQNTQRVGISWEASDPNGDKLRYKLFFKGEDESQWKLVEENLTQPRFLFSTEAIPDGKYRVKVEATDAQENQETSASTVSLVSRIYVVDNSPPEISDLKGTEVGPDEFEITASASDATSILSAAEYNMDAGKEWKAVAPEDGIFDFHKETFRVRVKPDEKNRDVPEHTLSLRVYDREGNSRVEKVLLRH